MTEERIDPLFKLLIERTRVLATVCDNAAEVLSEEFQDMITGPLAGVTEVLAKCPDVLAWDGSFNEADIIIERFRHNSQQYGPDAGVRIRHVPTDLAIESYSKHSFEDNERVARKALVTLVRNRWLAEQEAAEQAGTGSGR